VITNTTKDKGDYGLISVMRILAKQGIKTCLPVSEHLPFDLIAVNEKAQLLRVSVKHVKLYRDAIAVHLYSVYSNTKVTVAKRIDTSMIDCIAVYCPELDSCFFISAEQISQHKKVFTLKPRALLKRPSYSSVNNIAEDFQEISPLFKDGGKLENCILTTFESGQV